ncbi:MAG: hypothetical protein ACO1N0_17645 [Fluviicola sp.]
MKNALKISIPTAVSIIGSIFLYNILHRFITAFFMEQSKLIPEVKNDFPVNAFDYSLYIFCLSYLFTLIALPFILSVLSEKQFLKAGTMGVKLLVFEILVLILVWIFSPPDLISIILKFVVWQLPIFVNFIAIMVIRKKNYTN